MSQTFSRVLRAIAAASTVLVVAVGCNADRTLAPTEAKRPLSAGAKSNDLVPLDTGAVVVPTDSGTTVVPQSTQCDSTTSGFDTQPWYRC